MDAAVQHRRSIGVIATLFELGDDAEQRLALRETPLDQKAGCGQMGLDLLATGYSGCTVLHNAATRPPVMEQLVRW